MSATQKQLQLASKQAPFELVSNQPIPKPGPGYVFVKIQASALNPADWKIQAYGILVEEYPAVLGFDIAGEVVELGESVSKWKVGDKIFFKGVPSKENSQTGFSQYALAEAEYAARIPSNITVEEASAIPVVLAAAVVGLYGPKPIGAGFIPPFVEGGRDKYKNTPLVVLGGATGVGQSVIQVAKLSGFSPIITTASPKNASLLKSFGATHVLDRSLSDAKLASQISSITSQPITLVYDSVSTVSTEYTGYKLLSSSRPGQLIVVGGSLIKDEDKAPNKEIIATSGGFTYPNTRELGKQLFKELEGLVKRGEIRPNHVEVVSGGLAGVVEGLERLKKGEVSATKLVVRPQETP